MGHRYTSAEREVYLYYMHPFHAKKWKTSRKENLEEKQKNKAKIITRKEIVKGKSKHYNWKQKNNQENQWHRKLVLWKDQ
jgi:hypothetical protein